MEICSTLDTVKLIETDSFTAFFYHQLAIQGDTKKTAAPCRMTRGSATTECNTIYVMPFDSYSLYSYQVEENEWQSLCSCPYRDTGLTIIGSELVSIGGRDSSECPTTALFTLREGQWTVDLPPMRFARHTLTAARSFDSEYIFSIGGIGQLHGWTAHVELYQISQRAWTTLKELPCPLPLPSAALHDGRLSVVSVFPKEGAYTSSLLFLPHQHTHTISQMLTWTVLPPLPVAYTTAVALCGQLLLVGGYRQWPDMLATSSTVFQLLDKEWVEVGSVSAERASCLALSPSLGKLLVLGGYGEAFSRPHDSAEICDFL